MADDILSRIDTTRSGLCHGPDCRVKITEKSPSPDFHNEACAGRWAGRWSAPAEAPPERAHIWTTTSPCHCLSCGVDVLASTSPWCPDPAHMDLHNGAPPVGADLEPITGDFGPVTPVPRPLVLEPWTCEVCGKDGQGPGLRRLHEAHHQIEAENTGSAPIPAAQPWWRRLLRRSA